MLAVFVALLQSPHLSQHIWFSNQDVRQLWDVSQRIRQTKKSIQPFSTKSLVQVVNSLFMYKTLYHENSLEWDFDFTKQKEKPVGGNNRAFSVWYNAWFHFTLFSGQDNFSLMAVTMSSWELFTLWNIYSFPLLCGTFTMLILAVLRITILLIPISTWILQWYFKLNMSKIEFMLSHPKLVLWSLSYWWYHYSIPYANQKSKNSLAILFLPAFHF